MFPFITFASCFNFCNIKNAVALRTLLKLLTLLKLQTHQIAHEVRAIFQKRIFSMSLEEVLEQGLLPTCYICVPCGVEASDEILVPVIGMSLWLLSYNRSKILLMAFIFRWQCHLFIFEQY